VKRVGSSLLFAALAVSGIASASILAGTTPAAAPATASNPAPQQVRLPSRVKVGGIQVGGLAPSAAFGVLRLAYRAPLVVTLGDRTVSVAPSQLGAIAYVWPAVRRAQQARPGSSIPLTISVREGDVRSFVSRLARGYDRSAVDARVALEALTPHIYPEVVGRMVMREKAVAAIVEALRESRRKPLALPARGVEPKVKASSFGPMIVIRRDSKWLYFYERQTFVQRFPVATGQAVYPTPIGDFQIVTMWRNPWWYPPDSSWARGQHPIPPGPGNPLGTRWMGISAPGVGIHGTPDPASIGYSASHGCIRMFIPSAEWLFSHVKLGTPVFIRPV
jgi:lipoprotein-anchoring transpeptidase ErfK/SrfK